MKVICIDDKFKWEFGYRNYEPLDPSFGEICTVIDQTIHYCGLLIYKLEGYDEWYSSKKFIPISSIDETEFIREYKKELV